MCVWCGGVFVLGKVAPVVDELTSVGSIWEELWLPWVTCKGVKTLSPVDVKPQSFKLGGNIIRSLQSQVGDSRWEVGLLGAEEPEESRGSSPEWNNWKHNQNSGIRMEHSGIWESLTEDLNILDDGNEREDWNRVLGCVYWIRRNERE